MIIFFYRCKEDTIPSCANFTFTTPWQEEVHNLRCPLSYSREGRSRREVDLELPAVVGSQATETNINENRIEAMDINRLDFWRSFSFFA